MFVERVLAVEVLGAPITTELRLFVRVLMAPQMLLSAKGFVAKRALIDFHF